MTAPLARLRDAFVDDADPRSALFCTYGLDAPFFEAEILPAVFPVRLSLDRESGSRAAYLSAADAAMQAAPVTVLFDHLTGDGPGLPYVAARVDVGGRAFHPKLILLEYEDRLRAIVSSANLTRPAWTNLLELFVIEDLRPGRPHPWSAALQRFLEQLESFVPPERRSDVSQLRSSVAKVPAGGSGSLLQSSWDGSLLTQFLAGRNSAKRIDIVTPFFEGDEGSGVLSRLDALGKNPRGRLFVSAEAVDEGLEIRGPREKIDGLLKTGRWTLHRVAQEWDGDQEGAQLRALHGKMLVVGDERGCRVMVGSANITRAALSAAPPAGNVELVVVFETTPARLVHLLPQATPLTREDVEIVDRGDPTGEDDPSKTGAERWVEAAIFWADASAVEVRLLPHAPPISVSYEGTALGVVTARSQRFSVVLGESFAIEVADGETVGSVPLVLADPATFTPRGISSTIDFEAFCEMLAGVREPEMPVGELPRGPGSPAEQEPGLAPKRGAIPWRRILSAIHGLGVTLTQEAPFPRGVDYVLRNPTKLAGFLDRLKVEVRHGRFQEADHAYSLHELRRMLLKATHEMADQPESQALVAATAREVTAEFDLILSKVPDDLAPQLRILESEVTP